MAATYTTIPEVEPLGAPQRSKAKAKAKASRNIVLAVVFVVAAGAAAATAMKAQVSTVTKFSTECENDETFCGYINVKINNKCDENPEESFSFGVQAYKGDRVEGCNESFKRGWKADGSANCYGKECATRFLINDSTTAKTQCFRVTRETGYSQVVKLYCGSDVGVTFGVSCPK